MKLSIDELNQKISPIARKYDLRAVYLFGSYARNEATDQSDVDILVDRADSKIKGMFDMGALYEEFGIRSGTVAVKRCRHDGTGKKTLVNPMDPLTLPTI